VASLVVAMMQRGHWVRRWALLGALCGCAPAPTEAPGDDAGVAAQDTGATVLDTPALVLDAPSLAVDAPPAARDVGVDAGRPIDLGTVPRDAGPPAMDTGTLPTDVGTVLPDVARADVGSSVPDAPTPQEDCTRYPFSAATLLAERVGYGRNATGGDARRVYRVNTLSGDSTGSGSSGSLRRALESDEPWYIVFAVDGTITHRTRVNVRANKTVDGRGHDIHLRGELRLANVRNVVLSDIRLSNDLEGHCTQAGDVLNITGMGTVDPAAFTTRDIWIHHVEVFNGGDGLVDIRGGSGVTVSWSHFHTHLKGMLFQRDSADRETPGMRVTMHHNFFDRLSYRGPQLLHGRMHYFNNFQYQWMYYGVGSLGGAQLLSEHNVYEARNACTLSCRDDNPCGGTEWFNDQSRAMVTEWDANGVGNIRSTGDLFRNGARGASRNPDAVFDPTRDYAYTAEPATEALAMRVRAEAGPRTRYCR